MLLCELLRPHLIKVRLEAESKHEAIEELVDVLLQQHEISLAQRSLVLEAVIANERSVGTGMERGIAVPHGQTDQVEDILCVLGTSPKGIPFETRDGRPAHLLVLLVVPRRNFAGEVRALAGLKNLLDLPGMKEQIVSAPDATAVYDVIVSHERRQN